VELKVKRTYLLLVCDDDEENQLESYREREAQIGANGKVKYTYVIVSSQECRALHDEKIGNGSFENMAKLKYFGKAVTNQHLIEYIKSRVNSDYASCHFISKLYLLVSSLKAKN
jgi:hypothetical protein